MCRSINSIHVTHFRDAASFVKTTAQYILHKERSICIEWRKDGRLSDTAHKYTWGIPTCICAVWCVCRSFMLARNIDLSSEEVLSFLQVSVIRLLKHVT